MNLTEFSEKFNIIKSKGFVPLTKTGDGDAGGTLEDLLEISANCSKLPDLGEGQPELKCKKMSGKITLFSRDKNLWTINQIDAINQYGWRSEDGEGMTLQMSVNNQPNKRGFRWVIEEGHLCVVHNDGTIIYKISLCDLMAEFTYKCKCVILVDSETKSGEVRYLSATYYRGATGDQFNKLLNSNKIIVELRLYKKPNKPIRNRGTAIRISSNSISDLYSFKESI